MSRARAEYPMFNANTVTGTYTQVGPYYGAIEDILPPRVLRIGGAWDF